MQIILELTDSDKQVVYSQDSEWFFGLIREISGLQRAAQASCMSLIKFLFTTKHHSTPVTTAISVCAKLDSVGFLLMISN